MFHIGHRLVRFKSNGTINEGNAILRSDDVFREVRRLFVTQKNLVDLVEKEPLVGDNTIAFLRRSFRPFSFFTQFEATDAFHVLIQYENALSAGCAAP